MDSRRKKNSFYLGSQQRLKVHIPFSLQTLICIHNWKRRQQLFWQQKYSIQNWKSQLVKQHFLFCKQDIPTPHMINRPVVGQCAWRCQKFWPHNQYEISLCSCITEKQIVCLCCSIICEGVYIHQFNVGSLDDLGRDLTRVVLFSENSNFPRFIRLTWKTKNINIMNVKTDLLGSVLVNHAEDFFFSPEKKVCGLKVFLIRGVTTVF